MTARRTAPKTAPKTSETAWAARLRNATRTAMKTRLGPALDPHEAAVLARSAPDSSVAVLGHPTVARAYAKCVPLLDEAGQEALLDEWCWQAALAVGLADFPVPGHEPLALEGTVHPPRRYKHARDVIMPAAPDTAGPREMTPAEDAAATAAERASQASIARWAKDGQPSAEDPVTAEQVAEFLRTHAENPPPFDPVMDVPDDDDPGTAEQTVVQGITEGDE